MSNRPLDATHVPDPLSVVDTLHGRAVPDPYRWLEKADSPKSVRWLEERDREYEREAMTWPMRTLLAERIATLVHTDLWTPPRHRPGRLFATVRPAGGEHPRLVSLPEHGRATSHTVYDPVREDPSGRTTLDSWEPSPDGRLTAVQTSSGGVERGTLRVLRTDTGTQLGPTVHGVRYSHVAWVPTVYEKSCPHRTGSDGSLHLYYVRRDGERGVRGVWLRRVACGTDTLVHACTEPGTVPGVRVLNDRWLLITESHGTGHRTDLWLADLSRGCWKQPHLRPLQEGIDAETEVRPGPNGLLYLRTTWGAPRRRICSVDPSEPEPRYWREIVPESSRTTLDAFVPFILDGRGTALLVCHTRLGISSTTVYDARDGSLLHEIGLPGEGMVSGLEVTPDGTVFLSYADVATQQHVLKLAPGRTRPCPWPTEGAETPSTPVQHPLSEVERTVLWSRSQDGTEIPVTIFSLAGATASGSTLLHAYGGFGRPRQFGFSATVLAWLLSGGRYAVAHVRGGGDAGRTWHLRGSGRHKPRAVEDLIAAADSLVEAGLCTRRQLCLSGGSAGGLLVLAAATTRPDLCSAVIASAPLADMARFERMGLGRMWTREFGTVSDPDDFAALMSYSPYHRVLESTVRTPRRRFPSILLTGFDGDTRTDAAHPRKMCAALLSTVSQDPGRPPVLLRYERDVGHGPRAVSRAIALAADAHAFAAHRTGLPPR